jgi:hypothetical protein
MQGGGFSHRKDSMREPELTREEVPTEKMATGFSLLEVLISITFLTVVVVTVLQSMSYCLQVSGEAHKHWRDSLSKWSEVQELRSWQGTVGDPVIVLPGARPMSYQEVPAGAETSDDHWGVLRAAK